MTRTAPTPPPELVEIKPGRERRAYNLNAVVSALREDARKVDAELETALTEFCLALEDGRIDDAEARAVLLALARAFKTNSYHLSTLNLLDETGSEAALREVQRYEIHRAAHPLTGTGD